MVGQSIIEAMAWQARLNNIREDVIDEFSSIALLVYSGEKEHDYFCYGIRIDHYSFGFSIRIENKKPLPEYLTNLLYNQINPHYPLRFSQVDIKDKQFDYYHFLILTNGQEA